MFIDREVNGLKVENMEEAERAPVPTVQDLPVLVDSVRSAGLQIDVEVACSPYEIVLLINSRHSSAVELAVIFCAHKAQGIATRAIRMRKQ